MDSMRVRPSAIFPLVLSSLSFALVLVLVLSGQNPNLIPDGYLLSVNTTLLGQNLIKFNLDNSTSTTGTAAQVARDVSPKLSALVVSRAATIDEVFPGVPKLNVSSASPASTSIVITSTSTPTTLASAVPSLTVPQAAVQTNSKAIPISLVGTVFQVTLNSLAAGGSALQSIVGLFTAPTPGRATQYSLHVSGICEGSVPNTTVANTTSSLNITRCISYADAGVFLANLTSNISDSALISATNITVPILSRAPVIGKSTKGLIDLASVIVSAVFIISLIGNAASILLSVAALVLPSKGIIHMIGMGVTTISSQLLQVAAITSTTLAIGISSSINGFSSVSGLSATVGGTFLALIWIGYISAQAANFYWLSTWFVKFRTTAFKARQRTPEQMAAGYRGIKQEVLSDFKVEKVEYEETEVLTKGQSDMRGWNMI